MPEDATSLDEWDEDDVCAPLPNCWQLAGLPHLRSLELSEGRCRCNEPLQVPAPVDFVHGLDCLWASCESRPIQVTCAVQRICPPLLPARCRRPCVHWRRAPDQTLVPRKWQMSSWTLCPSKPARGRRKMVRRW